jgi:hypothetical protein
MLVPNIEYHQFLSARLSVIIHHPSDRPNSNPPKHILKCLTSNEVFGQLNGQITSRGPTTEQPSCKFKRSEHVLCQVRGIDIDVNIVESED